jgi:Tfp pilus assembly major pilin PilA
VVAIIGILAALTIPLYANVQQRARIARAQADSRALASAASIYAAHMGGIPTALSQLTSQVTNGQGQVAGPFCASGMTSKRMRAGALRMRLRRRGSYGDGKCSYACAEFDRTSRAAGGKRRRVKRSHTRRYAGPTSGETVLERLALTQV